MEPEEWERLADAFAAETGAELSRLEETFWPDPPDSSFRGFWGTIKALNERVRTAPAVKLDDKLALQRRINELCQRARQDQKRLAEERMERERELHDALTLSVESLSEAQTIPQIQEVRSDLAMLREQVVAESRRAPGRHNQVLWQLWQDTNQLAWARLNALWEEHAGTLAEILDNAERDLAAGNVRAAKDTIKQFHVAAAEQECSHRALRALRARAGSLWQRANDLGREKHQRYVEQAGRRVELWRHAHDRQEREIVALEQEIGLLERQVAAAPTDVGAALLRGRLADRRRALSRLENEKRDLERRIESTQVALQAD
jgi:hypothetical protein